jgi:hypothetical protein
MSYAINGEWPRHFKDDENDPTTKVQGAGFQAKIPGFSKRVGDSTDSYIMAHTV